MQNQGLVKVTVPKLVNCFQMLEKWEETISFSLNLTERALVTVKNRLKVGENLFHPTTLPNLEQLPSAHLFGNISFG